MKSSFAPTRPDHLEPRRVRQPEDAEVRVVAGRADDRDGFSEHELVRGVRVQVERGEEDGLRGVRVDLPGEG